MDTVKLRSLKRGTTGVSSDTCDFSVDEYGRLAMINGIPKCDQDLAYILMLPINTKDPLLKNIGSNIPHLIGTLASSEIAIFIEVETKKLLSNLSNLQQAYMLPPNETIDVNNNKTMVQIGYQPNTDPLNFAILISYTTKDGQGTITGAEI